MVLLFLERSFALRCNQCRYVPCPTEISSATESLAIGLWHPKREVCGVHVVNLAARHRGEVISRRILIDPSSHACAERQARRQHRAASCTNKRRGHSTRRNVCICADTMLADADNGNRQELATPWWVGPSCGSRLPRQAHARRAKKKSSRRKDLDLRLCGLHLTDPPVEHPENSRRQTHRRRRVVVMQHPASCMITGVSRLSL